MSEKLKEPLVSICVPCYNHAKYIPQFMDSILSQDYKNWELLITDDCSTDGSYELLKNYKDSRIKLFRNDKNRHLCDTMNNSFRYAKGKYICIMYTDDAMCPGKLSHDVNFMEEHPDIGVLYNDAIWVDDNNNVLQNTYIMPRISRTEILAKMYLNSNVLSIPGMFMRKSCLDDVGLHNRLLRLTQDYEHHIRLLFKYNFAISDVSTVYYRIRSDGGNLSNMNLYTINGQRIELTMALQAYVDNIKTADVLLQIFPDAIKYGVPKDSTVNYFLGRIALESDINSIKLFGLKLLYDFMQHNSNMDLLEKEYGFLPKDFMNLVAQDLIFVAMPMQKDIYKSKYKKYRALFNFTLSIVAVLLAVCLIP